MCANGSRQQQGIDYEFSYSPTAGGASILCHSACLRLTLAIIDVVNCFQSTLLLQEERLIITMPPLYKKWFQSKYPNVKWEESPSGKYVLELLNVGGEMVQWPKYFYPLILMKIGGWIEYD
jgi:hypothetical protein